MQNNIPSPNPFLTQWLLSGDCSRVLGEAGALVRDTYRAVVAKDSGALAASARVSEPYIAGRKHDRFNVDVIAGEGLPRGGYGASHEFGAEQRDAADDFIKVLAIVDSLP